jgi:hypothetical protein
LPRTLPLGPAHCPVLRQKCLAQPPDERSGVGYLFQHDAPLLHRISPRRTPRISGPNVIACGSRCGFCVFSSGFKQRVE